jgi:hypothetical protein
MIKNTPIETIINRAFDSLEVMVSCKEEIPKSKKRKCCGDDDKCKSKTNQKKKVKK